jgi:hypothetical protein
MWQPRPGACHTANEEVAKMTSSEAITHIMHAHIADIRQDAAQIRTQARRSKGLEADRRRKIAARLDRIKMRLNELAAFVLAI